MLYFPVADRIVVAMKFLNALIALSAVLLASSWSMAADFNQQRQQLIEKIQSGIRLTAEMTQKESLDPRVLEAINTVPRHAFVPEHLQDEAYDNRPLPIGYGQTISQPYIVALMTDLLQPEPGHKVLEIGTGSGYQAAILGQLVKNVYSIEIIEPLGVSSTRLLKSLGYHNIITRIADGYDGWKEYAPFDGIIVTAAISHIPPPLVDQLANGGRMVIPVGTRFQTQYLTLVKKDMQGEISTRSIVPVGFVPFTGGH
jgi:protein-L-isoaspartate(D-aspartate) O-methyltransferase